MEKKQPKPTTLEELNKINYNFINKGVYSIKDLDNK